MNKIETVKVNEVVEQWRISPSFWDIIGAKSGTVYFRFSRAVHGDEAGSYADNFARGWNVALTMLAQ